MVHRLRRAGGHIVLVDYWVVFVGVQMGVWKFIIVGGEDYWVVFGVQVGLWGMLQPFAQMWWIQS